MADNYLEKRMEDYARGRLGNHAAARTRRAGTAVIKYPPQGVLIIGAGNERSRAVVRRLVEAGNRVAFTATDRAEGTSLAQQCGGRFYPAEPAAVAQDLQKRGEGVDAVIAFGTDVPDVSLFAPRKVIVVADEPVDCREAVVIAGGSPEAVAMMILALVHPALELPAQVVRLG